jgi:hypothetical protein
MNKYGHSGENEHASFSEAHIRECECDAGAKTGIQGRRLEPGFAPGRRIDGRLANGQD